MVYKEGEINGFGNKRIVAFNFIRKRLSEKKTVKWLYKVRVHGPLGFVKGVGIQRGGNKTNLKVWDLVFSLKFKI